MIPKKPAPHLMWGACRLSEKFMLQQQDMERNDDSKKVIPLQATGRH
jgi:hypothetical protein